MATTEQGKNNPSFPPPGVFYHPSPQLTRNMSKADYFHLMWQQITNEDNLVNQRLIWMVFSQSFLFSAFTVLLNAPEKPKNPMFGHLQDELVWLIPCLAILSSGLVYVGILISLSRIGNFRRAYEQYPDDSSIIAFPSIQNEPPFRWLASLPPVLLPAIFAITWTGILISKILLHRGIH